MLIPTIIMGAIAISLVLYGLFKGKGQHIIGLKSALLMTAEVLPLLIFAFIVAGMVQALIPQEIISRWIGEGSGWKGIFIGTIAGGIMPGGPYVSLPIAGGFLRSGASIGTIVAFITGWSLLAFSRLPMDIGILGWKVTLIRLACTFFFPPIAGFIAYAIFGKINF
ncbi:MAG: permease [Actinobacteria bacterium]|nr:permease [Actinomycetota bacterium]